MQCSEMHNSVNIILFEHTSMFSVQCSCLANRNWSAFRFECVTVICYRFNLCILTIVCIAFSLVFFCILYDVWCMIKHWWVHSAHCAYNLVLSLATHLPLSKNAFESLDRFSEMKRLFSQKTFATTFYFSFLLWILIADATWGCLHFEFSRCTTIFHLYQLYDFLYINSVLNQLWYIAW